MGTFHILLLGGQKSGKKNIRFTTTMLRLDLCDFSDACAVVKGTINLLAIVVNKNEKADKDVAFEINAPFRSCISKNSKTLIDNAENFDIVMSIYNL